MSQGRPPQPDFPSRQISLFDAACLCIGKDPNMSARNARLFAERQAFRSKYQEAFHFADLAARKVGAEFGWELEYPDSMLAHESVCTFASAAALPRSSAEDETALAARAKIMTAIEKLAHVKTLRALDKARGEALREEDESLQKAVDEMLRWAAAGTLQIYGQSVDRPPGITNISTAELSVLAFRGDVENTECLYERSIDSPSNQKRWISVSVDRAVLVGLLGEGVVGNDENAICSVRTLAGKAYILKCIKAIYAACMTQGVKAPNINQIAPPTKALLAMASLTASTSAIKDQAEREEIKKLRGPPGVDGKGKAISELKISENMLP